MTKATRAVFLIFTCVLTGLLGAQEGPEAGRAGSYEQYLPPMSVAHTKVELSSNLLEKIESVPVEEGQTVSKGEVLVKFDASVIKAQIEVARAKADFEARIERARTDYEYYKEEYERYEKMGDATTPSETAKARHEMNKARLDLEELKRQKRQADAELTRLKAQAEDYVVHSPIDGVVSHRWVEPGEMAEQGQKLVEVMDPDVVEVRVSVDERYTEVRKGQEVMIRFPPAGDREFKGRVHSVSPYVESKSGTYQVRILVEPESRRVKPGMTCEVRFLSPSEE